jgi:hypothetical protein
MKYNPAEKEIILDRELNKLDRFVIKFCNLLKEYVIVSGYVSILLGRTRATEDVDLLVPKMSEIEFNDLWKKIHKNGFKCINTLDPKEAFSLMNEHAIRFQEKIPVPNIEFKMIKNDLDSYSLQNKIRVVIKKDIIFISPLELQIAYKLYLGSEMQDKDIEDARHLYKLFCDKINKEKLTLFIRKLNAEDKFKWIQ